MRSATQICEVNMAAKLVQNAGFASHYLQFIVWISGRNRREDDLKLDSNTSEAFVIDARARWNRGTSHRPSAPYLFIKPDINFNEAEAEQGGRRASE